MSLDKVLPMQTPIICSYPTHANVLSCLSEYQDSRQWFYEHYIQLFGKKNLAHHCYIDFYAPLPWKSCPWLDYQKVCPELIRKKWESFGEFIVNSIDLGFYVFLYLDTYFIPDSLNYQAFHRPHDTFFFGYNLREKFFHIADFYGKYPKYCHVTLDFFHTEKAFEKVVAPKNDDFINGILLMKPTRFWGPSLNINAMVTLFTEYLAAKTTKGYSDGYRKDVEQNKALWVFGIEIYNLLQNYLKLLAKEKIRPIDLRCFHVLYEHKKLMSERIAYCMKNQWMKNNDLLLTEARDIQQQAFILRNMMLKNTIARDENLIQHAFDLIPIIRDREIAMVENFLTDIKERLN